MSESILDPIHRIPEIHMPSFAAKHKWWEQQLCPAKLAIVWVERVNDLHCFAQTFWPISSSQIRTADFTQLITQNLVRYFHAPLRLTSTWNLTWIGDSMTLAFLGKKRTEVGLTVVRNYCGAGWHDWQKLSECFTDWLIWNCLLYTSDAADE